MIKAAKMVLRMNRFAKRCLQVAGFSVNLQTAFGSTRLAERRSDFNAARRPAYELIRSRYATYHSYIEDVIALHPTICVAVENAAANAGCKRRRMKLPWRRSAMSIFEPNEIAPKILIADDDPSIVRLVADRCSLMGFEVETACNGIEAMLMVRNGGFHALIVDVHMPKVDGLSVCAHLQELFTKPPHVVAMTGSRAAVTVERCDALSALYVAKGADFWSDLEAALVEICPSRADRIKRSGLRATRMAVPTRSRILLVDDDGDIERFLRIKLDTCGVDTLYAADAAQGYRVACREEPAVIVSDYAMPGGNAEHLLARLRTTRATRNIPFIVLSGHQLSGATERSLKREIGGGPGAVRILTKSADTTELLGTLQRFCGFQKQAMAG